MQNPPTELNNFCKALNQNKHLQARVKEAESPQKVVQIAASEGYSFSTVELRIWSKELSAAYFPWSEKGVNWRRNFFRQAKELDQ